MATLILVVQPKARMVVDARGLLHVGMVTEAKIKDAKAGLEPLE
ncbi:MAG: hypothetical protein RMJ44_08240 [Cytophagales bacterium]|nr:hypothetical protein [Cytophagales bacterium]